MSGNVWEWCNDKIQGLENHERFIKESQKDTKTGVLINPTGVSEGSDRVLRGGGYFFHARLCRPTDRGSYAPSHRTYDIGFRLVLFSPSV